MKLKASSTVFKATEELILSLLSREVRPEDAAAKGLMWISIGTGTLTGTGLENEVGRRAIFSAIKDSEASRVYSARFEAGYPSTDYEIREVGLVAGGTPALGTGIVVAGATIAPLVKRIDDTLTVDYKLYYG